MRKLLVFFFANYTTTKNAMVEMIQNTGYRGAPNMNTRWALQLEYNNFRM